MTVGPAHGGPVHGGLLHSTARLDPDPTRRLARLHLPGEAEPEDHSRADEIVARILSIPEEDLAESVATVVERFTGDREALLPVLVEHAASISSRLSAIDRVSSDRRLLLGAAFTAEFAVEGAALCNPSAVLHPSQTGLGAGQTRIAVSLRQIGEEHHSSIGFVSAIVGPGRTWRFEPREDVVTAERLPAVWSRPRFAHALRAGQDGPHGERRLSEVETAVVGALRESFTVDDIETAIGSLRPELLRRYDAGVDLDHIRRIAGSAYIARFTPRSALGRRVLMPADPCESVGMEDARFTRTTTDGGGSEYRASYTAYDGHTISSRLLVSPDLRVFSSSVLTGPPTTNKGMAFFPRRIDGVRLALTRTDGESISLARSPDGFAWEDVAVVHRPTELWEIVQTGNCGSPIETDRGWLVLTHGVGPLRRYCIGAMLLDLEHPEIVLARLRTPLIEPDGERGNGYVPSVVYSCGGIVVDGMLWIPYGVGDARIGVASIPVQELIDSMTAEEREPEQHEPEPADA